MRPPPASCTVRVTTRWLVSAWIRAWLIAQVSPAHSITQSPTVSRTTSTSCAAAIPAAAPQTRAARAATPPIKTGTRRRGWHGATGRRPRSRRCSPPTAPTTCQAGSRCQDQGLRCPAPAARRRCPHRRSRRCSRWTSAPFLRTRGGSRCCRWPRWCAGRGTIHDQNARPDVPPSGHAWRSPRSGPPPRRLRCSRPRSAGCRTGRQRAE
mmetsp:Transcript_1213/g.2379  ORF Transcript_1213/g.2379 Transcript_1213/m.2379 type:complete len:209 (+) Transcript_1213:1675-2301(+)